MTRYYISKKLICFAFDSRNRICVSQLFCKVVCNKLRSSCICSDDFRVFSISLLNLQTSSCLLIPCVSSLFENLNRCLGFFLSFVQKLMFQVVRVRLNQTNPVFKLIRVHPPCEVKFFKSLSFLLVLKIFVTSFC